jgi:acetyl-CoA carboxylase carboxyl transferase subunit beta
MAIFSRNIKYSTVRKNSGRKEMPAGIWLKCKKCSEAVFKDSLRDNLYVCPKCDYHNPISAQKRIELLTDEGSFKEIDADLESVDTLKFTGTASYQDKIVQNQKKTGMKDAIICGEASIEGIHYAIGVMDFRFLGASMGSVVGEKVTRLTEYATKKGLPLVICTASGGARMYEGMLSLMQMAKTSAALARHKDAGLPYIVILTHPTTAGVTASYASLGDLHLAEPGALIGFAGPRVIKQTTQSELPDGFQSSEFLMDKGFVDRIIHRKNLRGELALFLDYFSTGKSKKAVAK